jgi:hypothetical protein
VARSDSSWRSSSVRVPVLRRVAEKGLVCICFVLYFSDWAVSKRREFCRLGVSQEQCRVYLAWSDSKMISGRVLSGRVL